MALTKVTSGGITDGTITDDDINATLDLSSKTVTLPAASVTAHATNPTKASIEALGIDLPAADLTGTIADARFPSTLPAISGANLTGLAASLADLTDTTVSASDPTISTNPSAVGHLWINSTSGEQFVCIDNTAGGNKWKNQTGGNNVNIGSAIKASNNTWFYTDFSEAASVSGSTIVNLATGTSAISDTLPVSTGSRTSEAGSTVLAFSALTGSVRTNFTAGDPFSPSTHGLTMGCLFKKSAATGDLGLIYYGDTAADNHLFVRADFSGVNVISIGEDTGSSDTWTNISETISDNTWYFFVVTVSTSGTLKASINGAALTTYRTDGTAPTPTDAFFGLQGDSYNDNDSDHTFATAFWYKGVLSDSDIAAEYDYIKTVWTTAAI